MKAQTERLILRTWQETYYAPFAQLNSNKNVMLYFPKTLSLKQSNFFIKK